MVNSLQFWLRPLSESSLGHGKGQTVRKWLCSIIHKWYVYKSPQPKSNQVIHYESFFTNEITTKSHVLRGVYQNYIPDSVKSLLKQGFMAYGWQLMRIACMMQQSNETLRVDITPLALYQDSNGQHFWYFSSSIKVKELFYKGIWWDACYNISSQVIICINKIQTFFKKSNKRITQLLYVWNR